MNIIISHVTNRLDIRLIKLTVGNHSIPMALSFIKKQN
jgi:hypothetical protein